MVDVNRPEVLQAYVPFVEMYIKGVDILRGADGKPRTLINFSHDVYPGHTGGMWTMEIFDPDYVALEELLTSTAEDSVETAETAYGGTGGADEDGWIVNGAMFRYGYVGPNQEKVFSEGPQGEKYFYGSVHAYVPSYQAEGTYITLRGDTTAGGIGVREKPRTYEASYNLAIYEVIKKVAEENDWTIIESGAIELVGEDLPEEIQPVDPYRCDVSIDDTEESPPTYRRRENQGPMEFIDELCMKMRPRSPEFNGYSARLEYRADAKDGAEGGTAPTKAKGYLFIGPISVKKPWVREYRYLRDAKTDIISFTPTVNVNLIGTGGAAGVTYKQQSVRHGTLDAHFIDAHKDNRSLKYFKSRREKPPESTGEADAGPAQEGVQENPGGDAAIEGGQVGPGTLVPKKAPVPDKPVVEMSVHKNDRAEGDYQMMNYFLNMQIYANRGALEVMGDPSSELQPGNLVAIYVFVPSGDGTNRVDLHWVSTIWHINGVNHDIRSGEYTTKLELNRFGLGEGTPSTEAFYRTLEPLKGLRRSGG
jgi:hypothetical protein